MSDAIFWDRIARNYAKSPIKNESAYEATLNRVRGVLRSGDHVLELGCGTGSTALKLAPAVAQYTATDFSEEMLEIARERLAAAPMPGLEFKQSRAQDPMGDYQSVDAVLAFSLLHLVQDLDRSLNEIKSVLKPGGYFISKTACLGNMNPLIRWAIPLMQMIGKAPFVSVFTRDELQSKIAAAGFEIEDATSFPGAPGVWFMVAKKPEV